MRRYLLHLAIWLSQTLNVLLAGHPDETISARAHRNRGRPGWRRLELAINALFFDSRHCEKSYRADIERAWQLIEELDP